jgi:hypothetical protein
MCGHLSPDLSLDSLQETAKSTRVETLVDKYQALVDKLPLDKDQPLVDSLSTRAWSLSTRVSALVDKTL